MPDVRIFLNRQGCGVDGRAGYAVKFRVMGKITGWVTLVVAALWLTGCATGDPRLQGTWKSHKVPMPVEMVKVTKMETVKVRKGSRKTKKVPRTVTVARSKPAPPYIDLVVQYQRSHLIIELPPEDGDRSQRISLPYEVTTSDANSVVIAVREPVSGAKDHIRITFDGPNRYWVNPAGGEGWREYYERIDKRG